MWPALLTGPVLTGLRWLAYLAVLVGLLVLPYQCGQREGYARGQAEASVTSLKAQVQAERAHRESLQKLTALTNTALEQARAATARTESTRRRLQEQLHDYVQANPHPDCRVPADGLRLWRDANAAGHPDTDAPGAAAEQPVAGLPAAAAVDGQRPQQPDPQSPGDNRGIPILRRRAPGADAVDDPTVDWGGR